MSAPSMEKPRPSTRTQWWVLTVRFITPSLSNGELITVIGASVGFTAGFYIPFSIPWNHFVGGSGVATTWAIHHAHGHTAGRRVRRHFICLPGGNRFAAGRQSTVQVDADRPIDAVLAACQPGVRCCVGLTVALICGHAIGFRFHQGVPYIAGFCVLVIVIGALMSFGADLIGTATRNPDAMLPLLTLPILISDCYPSVSNR